MTKIMTKTLMLKTLCLSTITLTILGQSMSVTHASEAAMTDNDFARLVCGYLHQANNKSEALERIMTATESKINLTQLMKLEEIAQSEQEERDFCRQARPRL
ncbi:MAG: hypothetical protein AAFQ41_06300 [Cyanobacteria bacterium J06623_7]